MSAVHEAKKRMQLARLERKLEDDYVSWYKEQPQQVERARLQAQHKAAIQTLKDANEALQVAEITGENLEAAREAQAIAALVVERSQPPRRSASQYTKLSGA